MKYCFDMDGVLCDTPQAAYERAQPVMDVIQRVRNLYSAGHDITIFTARGTTTGKDWRGLTERQLSDWGVPYHRLILGKPEANFYIDDKAVNIKDWMEAPVA